MATYSEKYYYRKIADTGRAARLAARNGNDQASLCWRVEQATWQAHADMIGINPLDGRTNQ